MREFIGMFKELYFGTIDMWKNDRKEFWDVLSGYDINCLCILDILLGYITNHWKLK